MEVESQRKFRVIYMGSPKEAIAPLHRLLHDTQLAQAVELVGVVTQPPKMVGRGKKKQMQDVAVAVFARTQGLPLLQPVSAKDAEFLQAVTALKPDVIITCAYGQILTHEFLAIPQRATINIHPSLIPQYRGATPVPAALLAGDHTTGVTILFTVRKLDAGAIICQQPLEILDDDTSESLLERSFQMGADLLITAFSKLRDLDFRGIPQDESRVSHCGMLKKEDGHIDWQAASNHIYNQFRAYTPWPGVHSFFKGKRINLIQLKPVKQQPIFLEVGQVRFDKAQNSLYVGCGDNQLLQVVTIKPEGSAAMQADQFWNGLANKNEVYFD